MTGLSDLLSIDVSKLEGLLNTAGGANGASASLAATNPLDMLGEAGSLIKGIEDLASHPANLPGTLSQAFGSLSQIVPLPDTGIIGEIISVFNAIKEKLQPLQDLAGLDPSAMMNKAMQGAGGLDGIVQGVVGQVADGILSDIPPELAVPFAAVRDLAGGTPQTPEAVAAFFARFILGLDLQVLTGPSDVLGELHRNAGACGGDLNAVQARLVALTQAVDHAADALVGAAPDLGTIIAGLQTARTELDSLTGTVLPGALDRLAGDLGAIDPVATAARLDAALAPLIERVPIPPKGIGDFFLPPIRALAEGIDSLTAQMLADVFTELEQEIHDLIAGSDVAVLRDHIADLLTTIVAFLNDLPLTALRHKLTQALLGIEGKIGGLADFSPVQEIGQQVQKIADAIDHIDLSAITGKVAELKTQLQHVADGFPINDIKNELGSLLGAANAAVADLPPLLDDLKSQIDGLAQEVTHIDLSQAAQQSVGLLHDVRQHVKDALGSGDIPDALKAPIGALAGEVRKIDITASVDKPLDDLVAKIDITSALAPVQKGVDDAKAALQKLSPAAVTKALDKPFDEMIAALETISPAALIGKLSEGFQKAASQIDHLNPRVLVQPLQDEFDKLLGTLRQAADPAPLLAPLATAYHELLSLLDAADPSHLLGNAMAQVSHLPAALGGAASDAMAQKLGSGVPLPAGAAAVFKFGDILRPLVQLIAEARGVVHGTVEGVVADGLAAVSQPLALLAQATGGTGGHVAELGTIIAGRRGIVDATADAGPLPDLRASLERLARIEALMSGAGRSSAELNAAVVSLQLDTHITISFPGRQKLSQATDGLLGGLMTPSVGRSLHALGNSLSSFVPSALALPNAEAAVLARLDAVFDAVDPKPIADELDTLGDKIIGKLQSFAADIAKALVRLWNAVFDNLVPLTPQGLLDVIAQVFQAIRNQLSVLDPAQLAAELGGVLDAVVGALEAYSPAAFASTLGGVFDALKAKLQALDPAALLGDLNPLQGVIDQFKTLKPSVVLAPLAAQAQAVDDALAHLLDLDLAKIIAEAIANLKAQIESVIQQIEAELDGLLGDLQSAGGGGASASIG
jgi:hypothetical protein